MGTVPGKLLRKREFRVNTSRVLPEDFPGGPVVKNLPVNAGDMSSVPGLGRFHMPWSNYAHEPQLLSLSA